ncbi:hypothetical protein I4F81_009656 [Pyropia yezoensis]|uniref:Uncharacterized protein n=1 Tax=Pyropia yezoensis TaxID=2788 RepID=A0ACC3CAZ5_PYRYE|nr:hypothetical protein I4F81_009656 [Neopyropia yezoensis]
MTGDDGGMGMRARLPLGRPADRARPDVSAVVAASAGASSAPLGLRNRSRSSSSSVSGTSDTDGSLGGGPDECSTSSGGISSVSAAPSPGSHLAEEDAGADADGEAVDGTLLTPSARSRAAATSASPLATGVAPKIGYVSSGRRFPVPRTLDMVDSLAFPRNWGPSEAVVVSILALNCLSLVGLRSLPTGFYVALFAFWRLAYNVGLGVLLRSQSHSSVVTRWVEGLSPKATAALKRAVTGSMGADYRWSKAPVELNAWLVFRAGAMLVLANDGCTYVLLVAKCMADAGLPTGPGGVVAAAIGGSLVAFCYWAKASAHRCVGDFAWYWGDFFFLMDGELVFDGVFELFPHPMYTVGYAAYYGFALISRSYTLLLTSMVAHALQLLFLVAIEEPHIQRTYGPKAAKPASAAPSTTSAAAPSYYMTQLVAWRLAHWGGLGTLLYRQSARASWTRAAAARGDSPTAAFAQWKRVYYTSAVVNRVVFFVAAAHVAPGWVATCLASPAAAARTALGAGLGAIAFYATRSARDAIGEDAAAYADFFLPPTRKAPVYTGVFRYVNHPTAALGCLGTYGLALTTGSWALGAVAAASQLAHVAFVYTVEVPHMTRLYARRRDAAALERALRRHAARVAAAADEVPLVRDVKVRVADGVAAQSARLAAEAAGVVGAVGGMGRAIAERRESLRADIRALKSRLRAHDLYLKARAVRDGAVTSLQRLDGDEVVALLERVGLANPALWVDSDSEDEGILRRCRSSGDVGSTGPVSQVVR